ncbi:MAG: hypothetical protein K2P78_15250, partial [Gemmataceae bacterium]|nr:hypothetical protein [Gemmataceae bacterium]
MGPGIVTVLNATHQRRRSSAARLNVALDRFNPATGAFDEGTTLDMPVTVPRASPTRAADDLKARNALRRGFPGVESVVGKAGRAETATGPARSTWSSR